MESPRRIPARKTEREKSSIMDSPGRQTPKKQKATQQSKCKTPKRRSISKQADNPHGNDSYVTIDPNVKAYVIIPDANIPTGTLQDYIINLIKNNSPIQYIRLSSQSGRLGNYNPQHQGFSEWSVLLSNGYIVQDSTIPEGNPEEQHSGNKENELLDYSKLENINQFLTTPHDSSLTNLSSMTNGMTACNHFSGGNTSRSENPNITDMGNIIVINSLKQDSVLTNAASERVNERSIPELPQLSDV